MATEIPTGYKFQHMLAHTFPGFFSAITLFMAIDILSPIDLTSTVLWSKGIDGLVAFSGFILLVGSIIGIIIDGIHHWITEEIFENESEIKKLRCKRKCALLKYHFHLKKKGLTSDLIIDSNYVCNYINETCLYSNAKKYLLSLNKKESKLLFKVDGIVIQEFKAKDNGNDVWTICCDKCPADKYNLNRFYLYKFLGDKFSPLNDLLIESFYAYCEFYLNAFISLASFSIIAPVYLYNVFQIPGLFWPDGFPLLGAAISLFISILSIICYMRGFNAYRDYLLAENSALCGYIDSLTSDILPRKYEISEGNIILSAPTDKIESKEYSIKGKIVLGN